MLTDDLILVPARVVAVKVPEKLVQLDSDLRLELGGLGGSTPMSTSFFAAFGFLFLLHNSKLTAID